MNLPKRSRASNQLIAFQHFFGNGFFGLGEIKPLEDVMHDRTKLLGANLAELAINRNAPAGMDRIRVIVIGGELEIGILNFEEASTAALPLAVKQHAPALPERALKVALIPPECSHLPGAVGC